MPSAAPGHVDILRPPFPPGQLDVVRGFLDRVPAFGEDQRLALLSGSADPHSLVGLLAPAGYGQLLARPGGSWLELAVPPGPDQLSTVRTLLATALAHLREHGGLPAHLWQHDPTAELEMAAGDAGFVPDRTLLQMHCALPVPAELRGRVRPLTLRPFRPGVDEDAWLATNNRAFSDHPEQGVWTREDLEAREREPWFDPEGFLVLEEGGTVMASCWTKLHHPTEQEPEGEIYVISVDPDHHGTGLGRALTLAGLDWIAGRRVHRGMLFVDAANTSAITLYRSLGFEVSRVDEAFVATV